MGTLQRRQRQAGQTMVLLALVLGILMVIAALVIDVGSTHRVRAETHYVCDAGALAGIAQLAQTRAAGGANAVAASKARALAVVQANGYQVGQNGVTAITVTPYLADTGQVDHPQSDRFRCQISRELPQYFAGTFGIRRTGVTMYAVAALLGAVPIDIDFAQVGFPNRVNLSQFGPDAPKQFGDNHSPRWLDQNPAGTVPNPEYQEKGYEYEMFIPNDLAASDPNNQPIVRVEIFDPDCWNLNNIKGPQALQPNPPYGADGSGPWDNPNVPPPTFASGGIDEIRAPWPAGDNTGNTPFMDLATQTEFRIEDRAGTVVATATYGPLAVTPYWLELASPDNPAARQAPAVPPKDAQKATDLKWITPVGFQFDVSQYQLPLRMFVKTTAGSSETGYMLRMSLRRPAGHKFTKADYGITDSAALSMYGKGKVPINFARPDTNELRIGNVPAGARNITVNNFDTDVGSVSSTFTMHNYDSSNPGRTFPMLWPPGTPNGINPIVGQDGQTYYRGVRGQLSPNGQSRTDSMGIPATVKKPRTDANGNLILVNGVVQFEGEQAFNGGALALTYQAGTADTSVWEVLWDGIGDDLEIVLIR